MFVWRGFPRAKRSLSATSRSSETKFVAKIGVGLLPFISTASVWQKGRPVATDCAAYRRQLTIDTKSCRTEMLGDLTANYNGIPRSYYQDRAVARRIKAARFPLIKTLDSFRWDWPKKINRLQIHDLFRLQLIQDKANVIFLGLVGVGKSHLATALAYAACLRGKSVLFATLST